MPEALPFTESDDANRLLASDPLALTIGVLLDQQIPMERAFLAPHLLKERLGGELSAAAIAVLEEEDLIEVFRGPPALHRFPGSMAKRTRDLCRTLVDDYEGDAASLWTGASDGEELLARLTALPGFGPAKARVFVAVIGRRLDAGPPGWEQVAADWPSIADVDDFEKVYELREKKREMKTSRKQGS